MSARAAESLRSFGLLFRWQLLRMRTVLPLLVLIQVALGVGVIYGFAFLVPHISPTVALFFATGAPTLSLILLGLTVVPQETAQARLDGRFAYITALPVPRLAPMLADVAFWLLVQLPGTVVTLVLANLRFHAHLRLSVWVVPAIALVALTGAAVGYALAVSLPPAAIGQVSGFVSIALLLFSPINFPLSRLPEALQDVHRALPVTYMADVVRGGLSGRYDGSPALAFAVVAAYCVLGLVVSARVARRRG
jgi:ABC-2 type transport system permease protein